MKILILDPYPKTDYRVSKDTSGGYGTGNNFGDTIIPTILKKKLVNNSNWPPLFAAYTFSALRKNSHEVDYSKNLPEIIKKYDCIIIVTSIVSHETEIEKIKTIREKDPYKTIFAIGPFVTSNPELYEQYNIIIVFGEPEFFFFQEKDLSKHFNNKKINSNQNLIELEKLPYPDFIAMGYKLSEVNNLFGTGNSVPIMATRGCPFSCFKYCVYPLQQGRKVRQRSPNDIIKEMRYWKEKHFVNMFIFRDPVFSIDKKHTIEFCEKLVESNLNIQFVIETHLKILDKQLILLLKKAGLKAVKVGVESFSEDVLKDANRHSETKDQQLIKISELKKNNIAISAMYILGFPEDNEDSVLKTINYAIKLDTTYAQFSIWTPYPGTPVFKEYKDKIIAKKYEEFTQYQLVFQHKIFSKERIRALLSGAYSRYYFRIKWVLNCLKIFLIK